MRWARASDQRLTTETTMSESEASVQARRKSRASRSAFCPSWLPFVSFVIEFVSFVVVLRRLPVIVT